jgi:hypothetical protein
MLAAIADRGVPPVTDPKPAKRSAAKPAAAKPTTAKPTTAKPPAANAAPAKATPARTSPAKATPAKATPANAVVVPPVVPAPVVTTPAAATAAPGWYPVAAGSTQQRWWDGTAWTEHVYDPATAQPAATATTTAHHLKAPEGTSPTTVWFWITALTPIVAIAGLIPTGIYLGQFLSLNFDSATAFTQLSASPAYLISTLLGFVELVAYILFPVLDWRALGKRGVPKPFHWAWSFFAIALSSPIVYVIGRTVVVKRRTGKGLAPLWVFIALQIIAWIVFWIVIIIFITGFFAQFANQLSDSNEVF